MSLEAGAVSAAAFPSVSGLEISRRPEPGGRGCEPGAALREIGKRLGEWETRRKRRDVLLMGIDADAGSGEALEVDELREDLGKLRRNEEGMTPEQRARYAEPLKRLRKRIARNATGRMKSFLVSGIRIPASDRDGLWSFQCALDEIMAEDGAAMVGEARAALFERYSFAGFVDALMPVRLRIFYEAYGPVFVSHCRETGDPQCPWHNDAYGYDYVAEYECWMDEERRTFASILPPTMDGVRKEYAQLLRDAARRDGDGAYEGAFRRRLWKGGVPVGA